MIDWSKKALAGVIWRLRQEHSLTQGQLADRADVSLDDVKELEQGIWKGCDMEVVYKIARHFGLCPLVVFKRAQAKAIQLEGALRAES